MFKEDSLQKKKVQLDPVNKKFEVESFQKIQDVSARGDCESIEVVGVLSIFLKLKLKVMKFVLIEFIDLFFSFTSVIKFLLSTCFTFLLLIKKKKSS